MPFFEVTIVRTVVQRWRRTCDLCGKVEHTTSTDQHVSLTPRF